MKRLIVFALAFLPLSCGGSAPAAPSAPAIAQIGGVWHFSGQTTAITTSECVGQTLAALGVAPTGGNAQITQTGSALAVTTTDSATGNVTQFTGSVGASAVALTLQSCSLCALTAFRCTNGTLRDVTPQSGTVSATVSGSTMTGTQAATYNITVSGTNVAAGTLTINGAFSATKQ